MLFPCFFLHFFSFQLHVLCLLLSPELFISPVLPSLPHSSPLMTPSRSSSISFLPKCLVCWGRWLLSAMACLGSPFSWCHWQWSTTRYSTTTGERQGGWGRWGGERIAGTYCLTVWQHECVVDTQCVCTRICVNYTYIHYGDYYGTHM